MSDSPLFGTEGRPSVILLTRIMAVLLENDRVTRTMLSQAANVQYSRLLVQLNHLEKRGHVAHVIEDGRIVVELTEKGREFGQQLLALNC